MRFCLNIVAAQRRKSGIREIGGKIPSRSSPVGVDVATTPKQRKSAGPMNKKKNTPAACSGTKRHRQTCFGHSEEKSPRSSVPKKKQSMKQDNTMMPFPWGTRNSSPERGNPSKSVYTKSVYRNRLFVQYSSLRATGGRAFAGAATRNPGVPRRRDQKAFIASKGVPIIRSNEVWLFRAPNGERSLPPSLYRKKEVVAFLYSRCY